MIAIGFVGFAAVGAMLRWQIGRRLPTPLGTLLVNVAGAFLLGTLVGPEGNTAVLANLQFDLIYGVAGIGALTTFSTLIHELADLGRENRVRQFAYLGATSVLGVGAAWLGIRLS